MSAVEQFDPADDATPRTTKLRRLTRIARVLADIDPDDPHLVEHIKALKQRAYIALNNLTVAQGSGHSNFGRLRAAKPAAEARRQIAKETDLRVLPIIKEILATDPALSMQKIAEELDRRKVPPPTEGTLKGAWSRATVWAILNRNKL